jgi:type II secretory pathway component PulF
MSEQPVNQERGWWTYLKAILFLGPPVGAWAVLQIFCIPKLKQICADAGVFPGQTLFHTADFVMEHGLFLLAMAILIIGAFELASNKWRQYRGMILGLFIFIVNSAAIISISGMLIVALIAAPALLHR